MSTMKDATRVDRRETMAKRIGIECKGSGDNRRSCCAVCAKLPFRMQEPMLPVLAEQELGWDFEAGVYEFLYRTNQEDGPPMCLTPAAARKTADRCARHTKRLLSDMGKFGLLDHDGKKRSGWNNSRSRAVAPFVYEEIRVGRLLGTGGFSSVFEVLEVVPDEKLCFDEEDEKARLLVKENALAEFDCLLDKFGKDHDDEKEASKGAKPSKPTKEPQYVIKHLRRGLLKDPEKFERAAIDMALEAQLLLAMDHPNIISIRGWSMDGAESFANGMNTDFFIIIDRLSENLDQRLFRWRNSFKKYKSRLKLPFGKQKYISKLNDLLVDRFIAVYDITLALEYMHERRIIYRDLKASNVGFDMHGDLKLFDFGLSRLLPSKRSAMQDGYTMSRVGTKYYMAPEVRAKAPYNLSADMYSFGVVFWEIMTMCTPRETLQKLKKDELLPNRLCMLPICGCWPKHVQFMIEQCLANDPHARPKVSDIRNWLEQETEKLDATRDLASRCRRSSVRLDFSTVDTSASHTSNGSTEHRASLTSGDYDLESIQSSFVNFG